MYFWSIPVLVYSQKSLTWLSSLRSSGQNFEWTPQLWYLHRDCRIFPSLWCCTLIITDCTYYDVFLNIIFWSLLLYSHIYGQIFFCRTPKICDTLTVNDKVSYQSSSKVALQIFSGTQLYTGWFVNWGHYCRVWVIMSRDMVPYFSIIVDTLLWTLRQTSWISRKNALRGGYRD